MEQLGQMKEEQNILNKNVSDKYKNKTNNTVKDLEDMIHIDK